MLWCIANTSTTHRVAWHDPEFGSSRVRLRVRRYDRARRPIAVARLIVQVAAEPKNGLVDTAHGPALRANTPWQGILLTTRSTGAFVQKRRAIWRSKCRTKCLNK